MLAFAPFPLGNLLRTIRDLCVLIVIARNIVDHR